MAASLANEIMQTRYWCEVASSMNILAEIRRTYDNDSEYTESQLLDALVMTEVLVVDDFGTEKATQWVQDKFYQIINNRYVERRITILPATCRLTGWITMTG